MTARPVFKALNPMQAIPVIDDDGFVLWDAHAILVGLDPHHAHVGGVRGAHASPPCRSGRADAHCTRRARDPAPRGRRAVLAEPASACCRTRGCVRPITSQEREAARAVAELRGRRPQPARARGDRAIVTHAAMDHGEEVRRSR